MKSLFRVAPPLILILLCAAPSGAEIFLRGNAGWLDVKGGRTRGIGDAYQGGGGGSAEVGIGLTHTLAVGAEYAPGYNQPARHTIVTQDLDKASYSALLGNIFFRLEPIEEVRPYLSVGVGRSAFSFTYADTGKVFVSGTNVRRLATDRLNGWAIVFGFGFEAPITEHIDGGLRTRYLYNRWESLSQEGILFAFPKGDAYSIEANLKLHL
jgi:hypothetical protein